MTKSFWILSGFFLMTMLMIASGVLMAYNPKLFLRLLRKIARGDYYIRSHEFEEKMVGSEARIGGFFFVCGGLAFLYAWLKAIHALH